MSTTREQIESREKKIVEQAIGNKQSPQFWLARDRLARWTAFLKEFEIRDEIAEWAHRMEQRYGSELRFRDNTVTWVIALLICRYGESEYHWPAAFTDADVHRTKSWESGRHPEGVVMLKGKT